MHEVTGGAVETACGGRDEGLWSVLVTLPEAWEECLNSGVPMIRAAQRWVTLVAFVGVLGVILASCGGSASTNRIAFEDGDGIYVVDPDGSGLDKLIDGAAGYSAWSPDGGRIAFVAELTTSASGGTARDTAILVMNADGSDSTVISNDRHAEDPTWSPDGMQIAYESGGEIWVMDPDGSNARELTQQTHFGDPDWSPDGTRFAVECLDDRDDGQHREICVVDVDGSNPIQLTESPTTEGSQEPAWSPDGSQIAFTCHPEDEFTGYICVINGDGTGLSQVAPGRSPTWSPDGTMLAAKCGGSICTMNLDGSNIVEIHDVGVPRPKPAWAP